IYANAGYNMTLSSAYDFEEDDGGSMEMDSSSAIEIVADLSYSGSIWLAYYANDEGQGYYAIERQSYGFSGSLDMLMTSDAAMDNDEYSYEYSTVVEAAGTFRMDMDVSHEPGMPFLPASDEDISVEKLSTTSYDGTGTIHVDASIEMSSSGDLIDDYMEDYSEDMPIDFDGAISGEYDTFYSLEYDAETGMASAPPAISDPFSYMQPLITLGYDDEYYDDSQPLTGEYWTACAAYDAEDGFYTGYALPLGYLGGGFGMDVGDESAPYADIDGDGSGMVLGQVSADDARRFIADPTEFIDGIDESHLPGWVAYAMVGLVAAYCAGVAAVLASKKGRNGESPK
ncbi:hypothetical protein L0Y59_05095, partial [Candidatus Uhrbacteria bacterium]|nr:hypothetical protein [Candidatus Uhrbacteria bacterium]